jgi:uncharacterized protein
MEHYNATAQDLQSGRYAPAFEVGTRHDEVLWELWIDGFETAMQLRPESWVILLDSDEDTRTAMKGPILLTRINQGDSGLSEDEVKELTGKAPDEVPGCQCMGYGEQKRMAAPLRTSQCPNTTPAEAEA